MVKNHLKRLMMPPSWQIKRKGIKFVIRPNSGPHSFDLSFPLGLIIRDVLGYAKNLREADIILQERSVFVDGIRRKDSKFPVGLMDTIRIEESNDNFRVVLNEKGKLSIIKIKNDEVNLKLCRINGKCLVKKKIQINLDDGNNMLIEKNDYKAGDSLLIGLPKHEIKSHLKFEKGALIYLIDGKHTGSFGTVEDIAVKKITYKRKAGEVFETLKRYAFVVGKDKPVITLKEDK